MTGEHTFFDGEHLWQVPDLWEAAKGLPVDEIPLEALIPSESTGDFAWTARERAEEIRRVLEADLKYPIILTPTGLIADGMHRLTKAWLFGQKTIKTVRLPVMPKPSAPMAER